MLLHIQDYSMVELIRKCIPVPVILVTTLYL